MFTLSIALPSLLVALYGLLVGSFLNAWIWRLAHGKHVSRGRSMCPHCHTQLKWYELIPVLSYIGLRGRCRTCHKSISFQYPLVELLTALSWVGLFVYFQPKTSFGMAEFGVWLVVTTLLIASFVYDWLHMELPDQFTIPAIVVAASWLVVRWLLFHESSLAISQLICAGLFGGFYLLMWFGSRGKWLGDGDIRLAVLMGLILTPTQLVVAIFATYFIGAVISLVLIVLKFKTRKDAIAFGPFLIIGMYVGFFAGERLLDAYFKLLT
ncbi:prepilin peptidase [bacterium]|nr:prepilin peptidase [bacterium]